MQPFGNEADVLADPGGPQQQPPVSGEPAGEKPKNYTVQLSKKEYDALQSQLHEANENAKFWANRSQAPAPAAPKPPEPEPELNDAEVKAILGPSYTGDESPQQLVDAISEKGLEALKKRGVVTGEQAVELVRKAMAVTEARANKRIDATVTLAISEARASLDDDTALFRDYPDLQNQKSELYEATARVFQEWAQEDPLLKNDSVHTRKALRRAARLADAELRAQGSRGRTGDDDVDDQPDPRTQRIQQQSGGRGGTRGSQPLDTGRQQGLSPLAKQIMAKFNDGDGINITEADYERHNNYDLPTLTRRGGRR